MLYIINIIYKIYMYPEPEYLHKYNQQLHFSNQKSNTAFETCESDNPQVDKIINPQLSQKENKKDQKLLQLQGIIIEDFGENDDSFNLQENLQEDGHIRSQSNSQKNELMEQSSQKSNHSEDQYTDFKTNINCPYCGINTTTSFDSSPLILKELKKKYMFHKDCYNKLSNQEISYFKNLPQFPQAIIKPYQSSNSDFYLNQHLDFYKYYYGELTICHPLSNLIYLQIQRKIAIFNQNLTWSFFNQNPVPFHPNIICLPFMEFKVRLTIEMHGISMVYEFKMNLSEYENKYKINKFTACATSIDTIILEGEIIENNEKKIFVQKMNYKYNYYNINTPMVKLNNIKFKIPPIYQNKLYQTARNYYSNQYINYDQQSYFDPYSNYNQNYDLSNQQINPNHIKNTIPEIVDEFSAIYEAIAQKQVEEYVKTNAGSRHVQRFLKKCSQQNLQYFISAVYPILPKLVTCPYGNYTFQQLINVCPPQKKRILITKLGEDIPALAKTKQGTHALQTLISAVTFQNEIELINKSIFHDILELSKDNNGTHFIKKILIYFGNSSYKHVQFIHLDIINNFLEYCTDGNGVLVVKALMNQIKQVDLMRNQLIAKIQSNLETIIQDPYGNYVVQEAYILFKQLKVKGITTKIIQKFVPYSVNKFASNVIINCLQQYCGNQFYKAVEAMFIKIKNYEDMPKNVSGQHILKLLYQKSQNKIFIEDIKSIIPRQKMEKLGWEISTPKNNKNQKKQAQTVKIQNKSNFNMAVADIVLAKNNTFTKKKNNGNETTTVSNINGTFTPSFKKNDNKASNKKKS